MQLLRACVVFFALAPAVAHANLSHIGGGGAAFLLGLIAAVMLSPPLVATRLAPEGSRLATYGWATGVWLAMLFTACVAYGAVPFPQRMHWSNWVLPGVIAAVLAVYLVGVVAFLRRRA